MHVSFSMIFLHNYYLVNLFPQQYFFLCTIIGINNFALLMYHVILMLLPVLADSDVLCSPHCCATRCTAKNVCLLSEPLNVVTPVSLHFASKL